LYGLHINVWHSGTGVTTPRSPTYSIAEAPEYI
jgi:hypothetical protein